MSVEDWGRDLRELITRGLTYHGADQVIEVLESEIASLSLGLEAAPAILTVPYPVLGIDACVAGWVGVLLGQDGRLTVHVATTIDALVAQVRESAAVAVIAIDIPIGLPDNGSRRADELVRDALPGKASAVFRTLTRSAYSAEADDESREAWLLGPKILQIDAWVRGTPGSIVIEIHPELCFARLEGNPILVEKRTEEGITRRRAALARAGIVPPRWYSGAGFAEDDLLDASVAAWTAVRHLNRESESLPEVPEVFSDGLASAVWV